MPSTFNLRTLLWVVLVSALSMNYIQWNLDYQPAVATEVATAAANGNGLDSAPAPAANMAEVPASLATAAASGSTLDVPPAAAASPVGGALTAGSSAVAAAPAAANATPASAKVQVRTDVLDLDIGLAGGELTRADLLNYYINKGDAAPIRLLSRDSAESLFVLQSGLVGASGVAAPDHQAKFASNNAAYTLADGQDELRVPLTWSDGAGITVTKTYTFKRGHYGVWLEYQIDNASAAPWIYAPYAQLLRHNVPIETSYIKPDTYAFKGPAYFNGSKYEKLQLDDDDSLIDEDVTRGWLASLQHHFAAAIVPPTEGSYRFQLKREGNQFLFAARGASAQVAPGERALQQLTFFVGPKLQQQFDDLHPELYLATDYGWLSILSRPLFSLMAWVHRGVDNWGWTIVLVTLLLKLLLYPLSEASGKSMARMKTLTPRIKQLQETYKDQRDKLGKAMMELYQREKVNPVAGCLPMLVQIPVFLAFYWVLLESAEIRQAPFAGWITDLSVRDPWFVLPVIMAGAMYVQYKLNPQMGTDPIQQKIFMILPFAMSVMFAFFPAGLVLYWVTNTILSVLQQWNINRRIEAAAAKSRS